MAPQVFPKSTQPGCGTARSAAGTRRSCGEAALRKAFTGWQEAEGGEGAGRLRESPFPGFPGG